MKSSVGLLLSMAVLIGLWKQVITRNDPFVSKIGENIIKIQIYSKGRLYIYSTMH